MCIRDSPHAWWELLLLAVKLVAGNCRDGEASGNRQPGPGHLGDSGPLAPQEVAHIRVTLVEAIDPLGGTGYRATSLSWTALLGCD